MFIVCFLAGCENNRLNVDISQIKLEQNWTRFDVDLFEGGAEQLDQRQNLLVDRYGTFYSRFCQNILNIGVVGDPSMVYNLKGFVSDKNIMEIARDVSVKFENIPEIDEIKTAFKYYKYHFPDKLVPELITFISAFNYAVVATEDQVAIGLDMYMGSEYSYYPSIQMPKYKSKNMRREYIPYDCIKGWCTTEYMDLSGTPDLLTQMIETGKVLYIVEACFPNAHDSLKLGFSQAQLAWCAQNEFNMWAFFVNEKLLYSKKNNVIVKYLGEGPFTTDFDKESPSKTGAWIGLQIVRAYMNELNVSMPELMAEKDAQTILLESGYKAKG